MNQVKGAALWLKIGTIVWLVWVFLDYWFKHPLYSKGITNTFVGIPMIHVMIGIVAFIAATKLLAYRLSWPYIMGTFLAFLWGGTLVNLIMYAQVDYSILSIFMFLCRTTLYVLLLLVITTSAWLVGHHINSVVLLPNFKMAHAVHIAIGISVFMLAMFVLLFFNIFYFWTIGLIFFAPLVLFFKNSRTLISRLTQPIPMSENLTNVGIICILFIVLINAITFGFTLSPFPVGFDAQNYYVNLPKLMTEAGVLQRGYQPYNWSLLQAGGYGLTGRIELLLILSWYGLILVQWATWEIGKRIMGMKTEVVLVAILLFSFMPSVTTQASQELKVDLGLTFMLMAMVMAGFALFENLKLRPTRRSMVALSLIIGVLGGVSLGIKLTAIIALFGIIAILWYQSLGRMAFLGVFFTCLALVFFAQLDTRAGLRSYHASVAWIQIVSLFLGLGCMFFAIKDQWKKGLKVLYMSTVIAMASAMVFTPWLLKNYSEIPDPTFIQLLNGTNHGPVFNIKKIDRNLKQQNQ